MRSYRLSRGFIWRNLSVLVVVTVVVVAALWGGAEIADSEILTMGDYMVTVLITDAGFSILLPLVHIAPVVLYYDCRVRKEGLDLDEFTARRRNVP